MQMIHGDAAWSLRKFEPMWKALADEGDELAWHPHTWRWNDAARCWYNEMVDIEYISKAYETGFEAFEAAMGFRPDSCRAGISFHNNETIAKLEELGVKVDLSAQPGLRLYYSAPDLGAALTEGSDWTRTQAEPYHPSLVDYQRPASTGERAFGLLEIPLTVWRKPFGSFSFWKGLVPARIHGTPRLVRPIMKGWFISNLWGDPYRFELGFDEVVRRAAAKRIAHFATSLHPDDITDKNYQNITANLSYALTKAREIDMDLKFLTAKQAHVVFSDIEQ